MIKTINIVKTAKTQHFSTHIRADAARTGWANRTWTNKNSGQEQAALISFSGTNIVRTSLKATTLDKFVMGACVTNINKRADSKQRARNLVRELGTH
jgi:hypothetical protein